MRKRLREIAQGIARHWIDFLREKADVVGVGQRGCENLAGFFQRAATACEEIRFPKTAERKSTFILLETALVAIKKAWRGREPVVETAIGLLHAFRVHVFETM